MARGLVHDGGRDLRGPEGAQPLDSQQAGLHRGPPGPRHRLLEDGRGDLQLPRQGDPVGPEGRDGPQAEGDPGHTRLLVRRHHLRPAGPPAGIRNQDQGLLRGAHPRRRGDPLHPGRIRLLRHPRQGGQVDPHLDQEGRSDDPPGGLLPPVHLRRDGLHPGDAPLHRAARLDALQPAPGRARIPQVLRRYLHEGGGEEGSGVRAREATAAGGDTHPGIARVRFFSFVTFGAREPAPSGEKRTTTRISVRPFPLPGQ
mmetsp:Transcript_7916/g.19694  ORF Transcript_7916/g.19694 Transcript_7916/m.19694 type:complete len:256 (+) Transcript_7916:354-1121(+)